MPSKGLEDLLEAVSVVGDRKLRVLVVGSFRHDPKYRQRLLERYGNRVVLIGPRPHTEMPMFLAIADMVVLPQRVTRATIAQVPGKVFEAMAMARPIVATAVSDLPEILDGCGIVVPPESVDRLAEAIDQLLSRPEDARALGQDARVRCREHYSWDAMERVLDGRLRKWE
jgi:glycosyltransferase involved in cell wall biosynthesis